MSKTFVQGVAARFDDVGRCIEIRFSNLEMDDVAPLGLQRSRLHQDLKGGFSAETLHTLRQAKFAGLSHDAEISIINALAQLVFLSGSQFRGVCAFKICGRHTRLYSLVL